MTIFTNFGNFQEYFWNMAKAQPSNHLDRLRWISLPFKFARNHFLSEAVAFCIYPMLGFAMVWFQSRDIDRLRFLSERKRGLSNMRHPSSYFILGTECVRGATSPVLDLVFSRKNFSLSYSTVRRSFFFLQKPTFEPTNCFWSFFWGWLKMRFLPEGVFFLSWIWRF